MNIFLNYLNKRQKYRKILNEKMLYVDKLNEKIKKLEEPFFKCNDEKMLKFYQDLFNEYYILIKQENGNEFKYIIKGVYFFIDENSQYEDSLHFIDTIYDEYNITENRVSFNNNLSLRRLLKLFDDPETQLKKF